MHDRIALTQQDGARTMGNLNAEDVQGREQNFDSWKDDAGKRARHIYIQQNDWFLVNTTGFKYLGTTLRLVVLTQISSASVERAFSQLTHLIKLLGRNTLENNLELGTMIHCRRGKEHDYGNSED